MRVLTPVIGLAVLATFGCSVSASEGPRPSGEQGGAGAGAGFGGSTSVIPVGGSTSPVAGTSNSAGSYAQMGGSPSVAGSAGSIGQAGTPPVVSDGKAHVTTWVPPYHVQDAKQQLSADFGGTSMADGLSFLALQFWITDGAGTRLDKVSENDITWFHDWAKQHGVRILLCVDNNTGDWNWPEAVRSFRDNKDAFAQHLLSQVMMRDFDGVDLDLEGIVEASDDEKNAYIAFAQTLANGLHPLGKILTADSFHGQWNAPNWNWWPELLPVVDGITSMGYEQSGLDVDYQNLVDHAQTAPKKLMIGVPSYQGAWQNHTVGEQLGWLVQQGQVGTAIWDASLQASEWQTSAVWQQLKAIKSR